MVQGCQGPQGPLQREEKKDGLWYIEITYESGTVVKSVPDTYDKVKEMSKDMNKTLDFSKITFKNIKKYENPEPCIFELNGQGRLF